MLVFFVVEVYGDLLHLHALTHSSRTRRPAGLLGLQLLMPRRAQVGRDNVKYLPAPLGPVLRDNQARFDGFSEAYFVREDYASREGVAAREEGSIDLMRVQVDLRIN